MLRSDMRSFYLQILPSRYNIRVTDYRLESCNISTIKEILATEKMTEYVWAEFYFPDQSRFLSVSTKYFTNRIGC